MSGGESPLVGKQVVWFCFRPHRRLPFPGNANLEILSSFPGVVLEGGHREERPEVHTPGVQQSPVWSEALSYCARGGSVGREIYRAHLCGHDSVLCSPNSHFKRENWGREER